ncbi:FHA domain-containing protein [Limnoglobus roseus]|uniref:FHA domain-containing protein n=1 Tax=Limnoglobus roseus TaxID=2598579 RepID=A0A5C1AJA9_9BACT|nr:FHA domain-containing protein [Limnoglobus roseus]QEL19549.1 FHA domain-containing protein [Limnoglobus roseus]
MKVSLVVASGVHQGKVIPVAAQQFIIGRDPQCQLRPASQAISKQHCAILIRDKAVYLKDYGSTNGTFVNEVQLEPNAELLVKTGDRVRVGPLDFTMQIVLPRPSDSTPLPDSLNLTNSPTAEKLQQATGQKPPSPNASPAPKPKPQPIPGPGGSDPESDDNIAAMLLGMGEEASVPEGSTVFEMQSVNADGTPKKEETPAPEAKKGVPSREDSSNTANDILKKYMRRPR